MTTAAKPKAGLEDTVATSSAICYLDGDRGVLAYCGYDIHDLARHATFEEVCYLLWHRRLPTRAELGDLQIAARGRTSAARADPPPDADASRRAGGRGETMPAWTRCRTLTSALGHYDPDASRPLAAGQLPQGRAADRAVRVAGGHAGPSQRGQRTDSTGPGARARREFPVHAHRRAAERARDPGVRRRADPARRPRAERLDVRRARRRGDAHRHSLGDRRGGRRR